MASSALARASALLLLHSTSAAFVEVLTNKNIEESLKGDDLWFVKFYAPWCGHCKRLAPILDEIAARAGTSEGLRFGKVDCTKEKSACTTHKASSFPTIKLFHQGMEWEHRGARTAGALEALIARMRLPPVREIATPEQLRDALQTASFNGTALFVLADSADGSAGGEEAATVRSSFRAAARELQHRDTFVSTDNPEVVAALLAEGGEVAGAPPGGAVTPFIARAELNEAPRRLVVPPPLPGGLGGPSQLSKDHVTSFVAADRLPILSIASWTNFYMLADAGRPLVLFVADPAALNVAEVSLADCDLPGPAASFRNLARDDELRRKYVFAMLDYAANEEHIASTYYLSRDSLPRMIVLQKFSGSRAFAVDEGSDSSEAAMRAFLSRVSVGAAAFEYEGRWGMPARWWRTMKGYAPFLAAFDFLPSYSIAGSLAALLTSFVVWLVCFAPLPDPDFDSRGNIKPLKRD